MHISKGKEHMYVISQAARMDLNEIWDFSEKRWNVDQAESYYRKLTEVFAGLDIGTLRGRPVAGHHQMSSDTPWNLTPCSFGWVTVEISKSSASFTNEWMRFDISSTDRPYGSQLTAQAIAA